MGHSSSQRLWAKVHNLVNITQFKLSVSLMFESSRVICCTTLWIVYPIETYPSTCLSTLPLQIPGMLIAKFVVMVLSLYYPRYVCQRALGCYLILTNKAALIKWLQNCIFQSAIFWGWWMSLDTSGVALRIPLSRQEREHQRTKDWIVHNEASCPTFVNLYEIFWTSLEIATSPGSCLPNEHDMVDAS
jgi:hypothetical protein